MIEEEGETYRSETASASNRLNTMQDEYQDIFLIKKNTKNEIMLNRHPGALDISPMDAALNEQLAQMANRVYKSIVAPQSEEGAGSQDKTKLDHERGKHNEKLKPGFHFLEYAAKHFKNPIELISAPNQIVAPN